MLFAASENYDTTDQRSFVIFKFYIGKKFLIKIKMCQVQHFGHSENVYPDYDKRVSLGLNWVQLLLNHLKSDCHTRFDTIL